MNKNILVRLVFSAALLMAVSASAQTFAFSNIQYSVGSGTNEAALVVSWHDGKTPDSLTWVTNGILHFRHQPTILAMMQAIQSADDRILFTADPEFETASDYAVYSVFFDLTGSVELRLSASRGSGGSENGYPPYPGTITRKDG